MRFHKLFNLTSRKNKTYDLKKLFLYLIKLKIVNTFKSLCFPTGLVSNNFFKRLPTKF